MTAPLPLARELGDNQALLSELARVKALFQARSIAAVIGAPAPVTLQPVRLNPDIWPPEVWAEIERVQNSSGDPK
jgi:hypothetical protein